MTQSHTSTAVRASLVAGSFLGAAVFTLICTSSVSAQVYPPGTYPPPADQASPPPAEPPPAQGTVYTVGSQPAPAPYAPAPTAAPAPGQRIVVPYEEGMTIPPNGHLRTRRRTGLIVSGSVVFGVSYIIGNLIGSAVVSLRDAIDGERASGTIWVPIVGPLLVTERSGGVGPAIAAGLTQATGLALFIAGFAASKRELVYYTDRGRGLMFGAAPTRGGAMLTLSMM